MNSRHEARSSKSVKKVTVSVPVKVFKEGDYFVAYCPDLEVSSYAGTVELAKRRFEGAMRIFVEETVKRGTLEKELLGLGWTLRQKPSCDYQPPTLRPKVSTIRKRRPVNIVKEYNERVRIPCGSSEEAVTYAGIG